MSVSETSGKARKRERSNMAETTAGNRHDSSRSSENAAGNRQDSSRRLSENTRLLEPVEVASPLHVVILTVTVKLIISLLCGIMFGIALEKGRGKCGV